MTQHSNLLHGVVLREVARCADTSLTGVMQVYNHALLVKDGHGKLGKRECVQLGKVLSIAFRIKLCSTYILSWEPVGIVHLRPKTTCED